MTRSPTLSKSKQPNCVSRNDENVGKVQIEAVLQGFSFRGLLKSATLDWSRTLDGYELIASLEVPHAETGEPIRIHRVERVATAALVMFNDPGAVEYMVSCLFRGLLLHELDEGLLLRGKPLVEPHPEEQGHPRMVEGRPSLKPWRTDDENPPTSS